MKQLIFLLFVCLFCLGTLRPLGADSVFLKNGRVFRNVKVFEKNRSKYIIFKTGKLKRLDNVDVNRIEIKPVHWQGARKKSLSPEEINKLVQASIKRINEKKAALKVKKEREKSRLFQLRKERALHSALLPGWGQKQRGDRFLWAVYGGAFLGAVFYYYDSRRGFQAAQADFNEPAPFLLLLGGSDTGFALSASIYESRRSRLARQERITNESVALMGLVWFWNVLDAWLFTPGNGIKTSTIKGHGIQLYAGFNKKYLTFSLGIRF